MKRAIALLVGTAMLGIVLVGIAAAATPATSAEQLLLARLQEQYPSISRWEIRPFKGARTAEVPSVSDVSVVQLGPRSAIRVGTRLQWYAVAGFRSVATATHAIARGEKLDANLAALEDRNVLVSHCEPIVHAESLQGQRATKPLRAGEIICESSIEPQPSVARGDLVSVRYLGSRVVLVTKAIAQGDARTGEEVLVRNPQSRGVFRALVSGIDEVTIHE